MVLISRTASTAVVEQQTAWWLQASQLSQMQAINAMPLPSNLAAGFVLPGGVALKLSLSPLYLQLQCGTAAGAGRGMYYGVMSN